MSLEQRLRDLSARVTSQFNTLAPNPDRPGGYASPKVRRAQFAFGNGNEGSVTGATNNVGHQRMPIQLPVTTKRWRIRMVNRSPMQNVSTGVGNVTIAGFWLATAFRNLNTGDLNPGWQDGARQVLSGFTLVGATEYVSPWVEGPTDQIQQGLTHFINVGWSKSGTTIYCGSGGSFISPSNTTAEITANVPTSITYQAKSLFAISVEYEFVGQQKIGIAIGDSITEGTGPKFNIYTWHHQFEMRSGIPMATSAAFGSSAAQWADLATTNDNWKRIKDAGLNLDFAIVNLGTNDYIWGVDANTVENLKPKLNTVISRIKSEWGVRDVYGVTLAPRSIATGDIDTARLRINDYLRSGQPLYNGIFDFAAMLEAGPESNLLRAVYRGGLDGQDVTHWGPHGQQRASQAILINS